MRTSRDVGRSMIWLLLHWVFVCLFVNKTIFCLNLFYLDIWRLKGLGEWLPICQFRYVRAKGESLSLWEIQTSSFHFFQRRLHRENWPLGVNMEFLGRRWKILSVCEGSFELQWSWIICCQKCNFMHICTYVIFVQQRGPKLWPIAPCLGRVDVWTDDGCWQRGDPSSRLSARS